MSNPKYNWSFFEKELNQIQQIAKDTGKIKAVAKMLNVNTMSLLRYRKRYPALAKAIDTGLEEHKQHKFDQVTLEKIKYIIKKDGTLLDVAKYLGVTVRTVQNYCKKYPELAEITKSRKKAEVHLDYIHFEKIKYIIKKDGTLLDVAKYLGVTARTLYNYCKKYPEFAEITKSRSRKKPEVHLDYIQYNLLQIKQVAQKYGQIKKVAEFLKCSEITLRKYRKIFPPLKEAIDVGIKEYEVMAKQNKIEVKKEPPKKTIAKKPLRELIVDIVHVKDKSNYMLQSYIKKKEVESKKALRKRVKNCDEFDNMIGM